MSVLQQIPDDTLTARPVPRGAPADGGIRAPSRRRRADLVLALVLTGLVTAVQAWNLDGFPGVGDDEGTYLAQAWAVRSGEGLAHYTYWYDHPPVGWLQLATLTWLPELLLPGLSSVAAGRVVMLVPAAASCLLILVLCRRLGMRRWTAALALLLFGLSPLSVTLHRQVYLDNIAVPWMLAAFVLALSPRRHLWHHIAAGACASVSVLSKETMLLVLPALLYALHRGSHRTTRTFSFAGTITAFTLTAVVYPLYALLRGELLPGEGHVSLWDGVVFQLAGREGSGAVWQEGTGARQALVQWLDADPVLPVAGCAAAVLALAVARLRPAAVAVLLMVVVALRPDGYLPQMYVIQLLPFLAVCLAGVADAGARLATGPAAGARPPLRLAAGLAPAVLVAAACALLVAPRWHDGDRVAVTARGNGAYEQAARWLRTSLPGDTPAERARQRIVVDDTLWLDAVRGGAEPGLGAIWFYKVDLDPAVTRTLPRGHRDLDYIVSSPIIRADRNDLPIVRAALRNSTVVEVFGSGGDRIEIRRIGGSRP
ncbi:MAG TPA: glycosyltransferase family 39 protein [Streptomyces sp.]|uniref:ArnT family glycosyltransferase n=1 Tax=Streptomyces sp. TaxID=1931 RepID=UPI002D28CCA8|nr:glycosyltransferase family 39 protein [Streptomyces sp.]HZG04852.1 glycosyltransferase family 39 protein [Streptomyces sp.]